MGGYLLDTHAAIWVFIGDKKLSDTARHIIQDASNSVYISVVSAWELTIKLSTGKLRFPGNTAGFMRMAHDNNIIIIPIETAHLVVLEGLPFHQRDPFDRLIVTTALVENMTLITVDENIMRYDVPLVW
jgi:PIN domain nuclease of toxin-antitoxin system